MVNEMKYVLVKKDNHLDSNRCSELLVRKRKY